MPRERLPSPANTIRIAAHVELKEVENALRRLALQGKDLRKLFSSVRKYVRADQKDHARLERGPEGKWQALDADTLRKRSRQGKGRRHRGKRKRLRRRQPRMLGKLAGAYDITYSRSWIRATSRVKWSGAHADGDRVGRGAKLPGRVWLWASSGLLETIAAKAVDFAVQAWEKGR